MNIDIILMHILYTLSVMAISIPYALAWIILCKEILNIRIKTKDIILFLLLFNIFQVFVNYVISLQLLLVDFDNIVHSLTYEYLVFFIQGLFLCVILYRSKVKNILKVITAVYTSYFFIVTFFGVINQIIGVIFGYNVYEFSAAAYAMVSITVHVLTMLLSFLIAWVLRRIQFGYQFEVILENKKKAGMLLFCAIILKDGYRTLEILVGGIQNNYLYIAFGIFLILAVFLGLFYIAIIETNKQKLEYQNANILQNEVNVKSLENLQQKFRMLRHDFKNMLSSIYLHIESGDIASIETFAEDVGVRFDQLSNIQVVPIETDPIMITLPKKQNFFWNMRTYFTKVVQTMRARLLLAFCILGIVFLVVIVLRIFPKQGQDIITTLLGLSIFALISFMCMSVLHLNKEKLASQKILLESQMIYKNRLLQSQSEIVPIIDDYKQMLTKLKADAQQGSFKEMERMILDTTAFMDDRLGREIAKTTQLENIRIIEVRSLMLTKLLQMSDQKIAYRLEVILPIESLGMNIEDFNRCLGILLDNAMEACQGMEDGYIDILLLEEEGILNIVVKNSAQMSENLKAIYQEGISSKGKYRGIGLASYKRILSKYENISTRTTQREGEFIQELQIGG